MQNFNPRFPRGKRHGVEVLTDFERDFNPRFPRGKRLLAEFLMAENETFQSTLPAREATMMAK